MQYELLGRLRVTDEEGSSSIGAKKIETLFAVLLIRAGHVVSLEQLITEIWGEEAPRRANAGLHVYVSQLRKFLHRPDREESPIVTHPPGYLLRQGTDDIDFQVFENLVAGGRECARRHLYEEATERFERALDLWRGPVLADLRPGPITAGFATWLTETRLECTEALIECQLELGMHREIVGHLYSLVAEHPLREAFHRQLMLALYRSERQADALMAYQEAWRTLDDELGVRPCRSLQDLQRAILDADDDLDIRLPVQARRTVHARAVSR
jgi:DNA-binding SARP family transcriptional activator